MTLLEKAKQEHPGLDEDKIVTWMCPCDLGYESLPDGCGQMGPEQEICRECWNRQADAAGKSCHSEALRAEESRPVSDMPGDPSMALRMTEKEGGAGNGV